MHQPVLNGVPFGLNSRAGQTHEKKKDAYGLAKRKQRTKMLYSDQREADASDPRSHREVRRVSMRLRGRRLLIQLIHGDCCLAQPPSWVAALL